MKIFLTGGTGFIGRNIIEQLGHTYDIIAPARAELDLINSEAVLEFFKNNRVDVVVHAANIGGTRKQQHVFGTAHSNLKIFFNIIRAKPYFDRLINLGSGAEYGKQDSIIQASESFFDTRMPNDEYGLYKYVCSKYAAEVDYITHLRLFAVFGKYEDYEIRFISNAVCKALFGLPITLRQNLKFDYLCIDDFVKILEAFINKKPTSAFINVGYGEGIDLATVAELVKKEIGSTVPLLVSNKGRGKEYTCDASRLRKLLPDFTFTPFDIAIAKLVAYYKVILPSLNPAVFVRDI